MDKEKVNTFFKDFLASIVVFLVALPLCMGIAIASGVPPALGLIAGIIGGIVVGILGGAPMQVSGPAAGLAVMVFELVNQFGVKALYATGIIIGVVQISAGVFKLGQYFTAVSPALIRGMLSGIGALILGSQFHVMLDDKPAGSGLMNLATIPKAIYSVFEKSMDGGMPYAPTIGIISIVTILLWSNLKFKVTKVIPAPLVAVIGGSLIAYLLHFPVNFVPLPENLFAHWNANDILPTGEMLNAKFFMGAIAMAFVASAETLLCVNAVDRLTKTHSSYNKEIFGQGIANFIGGLLGGLPITGVIVRSSANVESGAKTKLSAILHGAWLLAFCMFFPQVLRMIPTSALAAILVLVGWKLLDIKGISKMYKESKTEFAVLAVTLGTIVAVDLLTGVIAGFVISVFVLALQNLDHSIIIDHEQGEQIITIKGRASFLNLPSMSNNLQAIKHNGDPITIDVSGMDYMDTAVQEKLEDWQQKLEANGHRVKMIKSAS